MPQRRWTPRRRTPGAARRACTRTSSRLGARVRLAEPEEARASPQQTRQAKKRIKELERELKRKALAETAALLVLSKKLSAIYGEGADE